MLFSINPDVGKLRELILHVAKKCADDPTFDVAKLHHILFRADFGAYGRFGEPITGVPYVKVEHGFAPAPWLPEAASDAGNTCQGKGTL